MFTGCLHSTKAIDRVGRLLSDAEYVRNLESLERKIGNLNNCVLSIIMYCPFTRHNRERERGRAKSIAHLNTL